MRGRKRMKNSRKLGVSGKDKKQVMDIYTYLFLNFSKGLGLFILKLIQQRLVNENMIKLVLLCLLVVSAVADCPLVPYPRRIVVGTINAQIDNDPKLHDNPVDFVYPLAQDLLPNGVSVAIGIASLEVNAHALLDFGIAYIPTPGLSALRFRLAVNDTGLGWRSLRFNFFASQSFLFQVEAVTPKNFTTLPDGKYTMYRAIPNFNTFQVQPVIRFFLNGATLRAKPFDAEYRAMEEQYRNLRTFSTNQRLLTYFDQALQNKKALEFKVTDVRIFLKLLKLTIETAGTDLVNFSYSYVIFSRRTLTQMHNFRSENFNVINGNQYRFPSLSNTGMIFSGVYGLKIAREQAFRMSLTNADMAANTFLNLDTNYPFFEFNFTYIAVDMKINFACQDCTDSPIIYDNKYCVASCPRAFSIIESNGVKYCDRCDVEKIKVVDSVTNQCVCAKRHFLDATADTCRPCSYDCMTCSSPNKCLTCDNANLQTKRTMNNAGRCECPAQGFYDDKNAENIICQKCDSKCLTCNGPFAHDCLTCTADRELDANNFCLCKNGFSENGSGGCICLSNNINSNGICITSCSQNQELVAQGSNQFCRCKAGFISSGYSCIKCSGTSVWNSVTQQCQCQAPRVLINNVCTGCGVNQVYDSVAKTCTCSNGAYEKTDGSCVVCPPKQVLMDDVCDCIYNYYKTVTGVCRPCLKETDGPQCKRNVF